MGLIFAENPEVNLGDLTKGRSLAAVPVGGRYRIIDFVLSNMVNSGIINVGITTAQNAQSLNDHLGTGKNWDMDRKDNGLFVLQPEGVEGRIQGGIDIIHGIRSYLMKSKQDYIIVSDCNTICNIKYDDIVKFHEEKGADITVVYTEVGKLTDKEIEKQILLDIDEVSGEVTDIQVYPSKQKNNNSYMHMFLINKELLLEKVEDCVAHGEHKLSKNLLLANLDELKIYAYHFAGYSKKIDSVKSFFEFNLDLLNKDIKDELFGTDSDDRIYTKVKDTVPTKYTKTADVSGSFVADGCIIEGKVENSIIFRGVHIGKGASVMNSIIMQNSEIMDNCLLENVVFDKEVIIRSGKKLVGQNTYPMVIGKRTIV